MSLGGDALEDVEKAAIDRAVANGVIVVASAGNEGAAGMGFPGAYPPVISAGASGWTKEWLDPTTDLPYYRMWWLQSDLLDYIDIPELDFVEQVYVTDFSSRELPGQELDVLAPGSWVRGPYPGWPGYSHLPWLSKGIGDLMGPNPGNFYYVGGTSMAAPHITAIAALLLEKNPNLMQEDIENILKDSALPIPAGCRTVWDLIVGDYVEYCWEDDASGSGLVQADTALGAVP
jgi:subtilisin family serine protease